jgi:hypothetical protein
MKWDRFECEPGNPLPCTVCEAPIPDEDAIVSDFAFGLRTTLDTTTEQLEPFDKAFDMDVQADFHICRQCAQAYGALAFELGPEAWLEKYLEEETGIMSREEALKLLE